MGRKVLVITAIGILDLAFIFMMGGRFDLGDISRSDSPPSIVRPYFVLSPESPKEEQHQARAEVPKITDHRNKQSYKVNHIRSRGRTVKTDEEGSRPNSSQNRRSGDDKQSKLKDTIIFVKSDRMSFSDNVEVTQISDLDADSDVPAPIRSKKRSFLARTVPLVKKPYEWMRDLVSKIK